MMCYSAMVEQSLHRLARRFRAQVDFDQIERTFRQRIQFPKEFQISRASEFNFDNPQTDAETRIKTVIDEFRTAKGAEIETKLFEQKTRLTQAERAINDAQAAGKQPTKKAHNDQRVATDKIESFTRWKSDLWRTEAQKRDARIYDNHFVPIVVKKNGANLIQLGRYHLRRRGKPPSFDDQYAGLYNARRDNLEKFWTPEFGKTHALMCIGSFFENVERNGQKAVAHFTPKDGREMIIACLYSDWGDPAADGFLSFAAVTDDPPPEVQAAGHNRIIINLEERAIDDWLSPEGKSFADLQKVLEQRSRPYYGHEILAAAA
jgi:putative SOS response-associated peptidase YedK